MLLRKAQRKQASLKIGLSGTSGSGKTYSALLLASGMADWEKICVVDTENGSADLYDTLGEYNVITLQAPFSPERYIEAISTAEQAGMEVIIIDSITHEWDGKGGCLEIVDKLGGKYQDWGKVTPRHQAFIQKILQSPAHVITTVRRKQDYEMTKDSNGKMKVEKAGLKEITREGFEYELTLSFAINQNHLAEVSKDRTSLFMNEPEFTISKETGEKLIAWVQGGAPEPKITQEQLHQINSLIEETSSDIDVFFNYFNVKTIDEMTYRKAEEAISMLNSKKKKLSKESE